MFSFSSMILRVLLPAAVIGMVGAGAWFLHEEGLRTAREDGRVQAQEQCVLQASAESAKEIDRLKAQLAEQANINRAAQDTVAEAQKQADRAHAELNAERIAHDMTRQNMCHAGCRIHIPGAGDKELIP